MAYGRTSRHKRLEKRQPVCRMTNTLNDQPLQLSTSTSTSSRKMIFQKVPLLTLLLITLVGALILPGTQRPYNPSSLFGSSYMNRLDEVILQRLQTVSQYPDLRFRNGGLARVRLTVPPSRPTGPDSSVLKDFTYLELAFKSGSHTSDLSQKYWRTLSSNGAAEVPEARVRWGPPVFDIGTSVATLDRKILIDWEYLVMGFGSVGFDAADRFLKAAGYRGTYGAVEFSESRQFGLNYCFESLAMEGGGFESVIIGFRGNEFRNVSPMGTLLCP
ncbi:MAG: hypothetical protein Q9193_005053 [Seirophora villosa]